MANRLTTDQFVSSARDIHGDRYDYSNVTYVRSHDFIALGCHLHGTFLMRARCHQQGQGCPKCAHSFPVTPEEFNRRSKEKHGDKYEVLSFKSMKRKAQFCCRDHGVFSVSGEVHLAKDGGCPVCWTLTRVAGLSPGNTSKVETEWLDSIGVSKNYRQHPLTISGRNIRVDGFDPDTNTAYECHGSYWHGNPEFYKPDEVNRTLGVTFGELYQRTVERDNLIRSSYDLVVKWVR